MEIAQSTTDVLMSSCPEYQEFSDFYKRIVNRYLCGNTMYYRTSYDSPFIIAPNVFANYKEDVRQGLLIMFADKESKTYAIAAMMNDAIKSPLSHSAIVCGDGIDWLFVWSDVEKIMISLLTNDLDKEEYILKTRRELFDVVYGKGKDGIKEKENS